MPLRFITVDRTTPYLLPPSIDDWLPENHLARFVVDVVAQLDTSAMENSYSGRGSNAWPPKLMISLLFYGYATGVFSSRKLERATHDSVAFRYLCANQHPDHDSIATFRRRFLGELEGLFVQILHVGREMGLIKLGNVSLDGTKVKANASKHKALSWAHACKLEAQFESEVKELMRLANEADASDLPDGFSIPEELSIREKRLAAIRDAKSKIEDRAAERHARDMAAYEEKVAAREAKEKSTGKKARGTAPKMPEKGPQDKDQVNLTDEESRIMPTSGGGFEQAYNAQAAVDMESMVVVATDLSHNPNDKREMEAVVETLTKLPDELGGVEKVVADTGYFSEHNVKVCEQHQLQPLISHGRQPHHPPLAELIARDGSSSEATTSDDPVQRMKDELKSEAGRAIYAKRKTTVEPVFGIIKHVMGFRQFSMRGLKKAKGEWSIVCMAWNLRRLFTLQAA
jgi:transposase